MPTFVLYFCRSCQLFSPPKPDSSFSNSNLQLNLVYNLPAGTVRINQMEEAWWGKDPTLSWHLPRMPCCCSGAVGGLWGSVLRADRASSGGQVSAPSPQPHGHSSGRPTPTHLPPGLLPFLTPFLTFFESCEREKHKQDAEGRLGRPGPGTV